MWAVKLVIILLLSVSSAVGKIGSCESYNVVLVEMNDCKAKFVNKLNETKSSLDNCPEYYKDAQACFDQIMHFCFKDEEEKSEKVISKLKEAFGDEAEFCKLGFLASFHVEEVCTLHGGNEANIADCETEFRDKFESTFDKTGSASTDLCGIYERARTCQTNLILECDIPSAAEYHEGLFFNPYCENERKKINETAVKLYEGDYKEDNTATYVTVVIVIILLLLALAVLYFLLRRRDKNRAEIRKRKSTVRRANGEDQGNDTEMQPIQTDAVVTGDDEVSSA